MRPPHFGVTTATLYFPAVAGRAKPSPSQAAHEQHQTRHRLLGVQKMEWVLRIASLPRKSVSRGEAFGEMHHRLSAHPQWNARLESLDVSLWDRELFYAIQSPERLQSLAGRYRELFAT
jgi:hypothetical protein